MSRALDSISLAVSQGTGIVVKIVTVPLLLTWIGDEGYALFNWTVVAAGYLALVIPPISNGAYVLIVQALADGDEDSAWKVQQVQLAMGVLIGTVLLLLFLVIPFFVNPPTNISMQTSIVLFGLIGVSTFFETINSSFHGVLYAKKMFQAVAIRESAVSLVASLISVSFAWFLKSPESLAIGLATGSLITISANAIIIRKKVSKRAVAFAWDKKIVCRITQLCLKTYLHRASLTISATVDRFLFPFVVSMERLAPYAVAGQVPNTLQRLANPVLSTYSPDVTASAQKNDSKSIAFALNASYTVLAVACCVILIPCSATPVILRLWLGSHFNSQGPWVAFFLGLTACLDLTVGVFNDYAYGLHKQHKLVFCTLGRIAIVIPAILLLAGPLGIVGIAIANFISLLLTFPIYISMLVKDKSFLIISRITLKYLSIVGASLGIAIPMLVLSWRCEQVVSQVVLLASILLSVPLTWVLHVKSGLVESSTNPFKRPTVSRTT